VALFCCWLVTVPTRRASTPLPLPVLAGPLLPRVITDVAAVFAGTPLLVTTLTLLLTVTLRLPTPVCAVVVDTVRNWRVFSGWPGFFCNSASREANEATGAGGLLAATMWRSCTATGGCAPARTAAEPTRLVRVGATAANAVTCALANVSRLIAIVD